MKVVVVRGRVLDLSESPVPRDALGALAPKTELTVAGVFDDEERLLPLVSGYLTTELSAGRIASQTALTYGRNLGYLHAHVKGRREFASCDRDEAFLEIRTHVIEEYFAHAREECGVSKKTIRNRDSSYQSFFDVGLCEGVDDAPALRTMPSPYASGLLSPVPNKSLIRGCTLIELKALILATNSERERCLLQFMFDAGVRRSEVPRVTLKAINDALKFQDTVFISRGGTEGVNADYCPLHIDGSKGGADSTKPRDTLVSRAMLQRVMKYHASPLYRGHKRQFGSEADTPAFLNAEGRPYTARSVSKLLDRTSTRALNARQLDRKVSPHKLRHGNAYALLRTPDIGADYLDRLVAVQKTLGHSHLQTAEVYTQVPHDLYLKLVRPGTEMKTKASEMAELAQQTRLTITMRDVK